MILITTYYGLRRSEMNGISWRSIDLVNDTITIQRVVVLKKTIHRKEKLKINSATVHTHYFPI